MTEEGIKEKADKIGKRIGLTIVALLLLFFIGWMNRYRYERIHSTEGREQIARINRYTEQICYSQNDGTWNSTRLPTPAQQPSSVVSNSGNNEFGLIPVPQPQKPIAETHIGGDGIDFKPLPQSQQPSAGNANSGAIGEPLSKYTDQNSVVEPLNDLGFKPLPQNFCQ